MKGKILVGTNEYWVLSLILAFSFAISVPLISAVPAHAQTNSPPAFEAATYWLHSSESAAPIRPVGVPVVATDPDPRDKLIYSLEGEDSIFFSIAESSGQLETREPLDYETRSTYLVKVKATDTGGLFDIASVNINVTNIDEPGKVELTPIITNIGPGAHATLTDPDNNLFNVSWQWATSYDQTTWRNVDGAESPSFVPREEDLRQFLRVSATYSDGHGPGKMAATLFDDDVLPGGNHSPEFPFSESGVRSTIANIPSGGKIGQPMLASDLDGDLLTYWLTGEASMFFEIGPHSGQLSAKSSLDGNFTGRYFGNVHVFDGRGGNGTKGIRVDVGILPATVTTPVTEGEVAGTAVSSTKEKETPSKDPSAGFAAYQFAQATSPSIPPESASEYDTASSTETDPKQPARSDVTEARIPGTPGHHRSPAAEQPSLGEQEQVSPAATSMNSPPPLNSIEDAATSNAVPLDEDEKNTTAEGSALWTLFRWAAWTFLCALIVAVVVLLLLKIRRINRRDVRLPPPTFGPERRISS